MEPILPSPQTPENNGPLPLEKTAPSSIESRPNTGIEQPRQGAPQAVQQQAPPQMTDPAQSVIPAPVSPTGSNLPDDNPAAADDVDVIEKEWVDKAKRIVGATKDDPHQQEKEVSRLQADYLMKRYGKQMKLSE